MEVIRGTMETQITYEVVFYYERGVVCGFGFPCDANGNLLDGLTDCAKENYKYCMEHPEEFEVYNEIHRLERTWRNPNTGKCDCCGETIELYDQYMGACECPNCGQWYNLWGQKLLPPRGWGWDGTPFDDDY